MRITFGLSFALLLAAGCGGLTGPTQIFQPRPPGERYEDSLRQAALDQTALGGAWLTARQASLLSPARAELPLRETVFFDPARPTAFAWEISARRGQILEAEAEPEQEISAEVFVDLLWRGEGGGEEAPRTVASSEDGRTFSWQVERDGDYLLRLQPELLVGGLFTVTARVLPVLSAFPVEGATARDVGSRFGDPRDGGRRRHEGVDIFAPRGTPAVAPQAGRIQRVGENRLGGKVVWMRTDGGLGLYFAHLDEQLVSLGQRVAAGEPVGRVGNTGNARSTPPHLHFGIYDGGALDPWPFLHRPSQEAPEVRADLAPAGGWVRVRGSTANFRGGPSTGDEILGSLPRSSALEVRGARGEWYRARSPLLGDGWAHESVVEPATAPLRRRQLDEAQLLRARPRPDAPAIAALEEGTSVAVLASAEDSDLVETGEGRRGWLVPPWDLAGTS